MRKILTIMIIGFLFSNGLTAIAITNIPTFTEKVLQESIFINKPIVTEEDEYVNVNLKEAESFLLKADKPAIPVFTHVFTFPFGTKINSVEVHFSEVRELTLSKDIKPFPKPLINTESRTLEKDEAVYGSAKLYPPNSYSFNTGAGLDDNKHVVYLAVQCYPVRYSPIQNMIYYSENADISITYEEPTNLLTFPDENDLVIIAPSEFSAKLQPLINHKNKRGVNTILKTTEDIYNEYNGYDEAEEIKYFIKDAIEDWGVEYVLLVGDVNKLPIRSAWYYNNLHGFYWNHSVISDLYYGDIYDEHGEFCSWDTNGNGVYGEVYRNCTGVNDTFDLYPDVNIGRLACTEGKEVEIVVDKIIHYEIFTYGQSWFNNIILMGGDTFVGDDWYDGEEKNKLTEQIMSDFTPVRLWTSKNTFTPQKINNAINNGAGFIDYAGHGVELGISTHPPNSSKWIKYTHINLFGALNGYKLPIVFFDTCLTAKLDYTLAEYLGFNLGSNYEDLLINSNNSPELVLNLKNYSSHPESIFDTLVDCFAWRWVEKKHGGAIATIGATRVARGDLEFGCNFLSLKYYEAYSSSKTVSQMLSKAQISYLNIHPKDYFTVQEFVLLGDPSLKIGGFEETSRSSGIHRNQNLIQNKLLILILERFPNAFPILRQLIEQ